MCSPHQKEEASTSTLKSLVGVLSVTSLGLLIGVIVLAVQQGGGATETATPRLRS